ncbi:uncharacterized protein LOC110429663 isoform X2 [Sorghum bicolor]|uniref:uncharacterized protein LOC110429663 isoform X2 n=1 Tax=Sorghum bicolor TaxID=4558 RepID=UPI00081AB515|nr:uncharacterized protein LOC110429663 isoform X2 [Sorghum bicolor]|eukprot:XP_021301631.1 uncharacterized protein LOC110429663 isoform X2 [Sorghum bicolor]
MGNKGPVPTQELTIDDIKIDDEAPSKAAPPSTSSVVNKKSKTDVEREQLFGGSSDDVHTPRKKSTQEILTKYKFKGVPHGKKQDKGMTNQTKQGMAHAAGSTGHGDG